MERRREQRMRITLPAAVVRRGEMEPVTVVDASYRGLFVRMANAPSVRQLVKLRIALPTGEVEVHAVVVRLVDEAPGRTGVGLRFFALNGQDRSEWEAFITAALHGSRAA